MNEGFLFNVAMLAAVISLLILFLKKFRQPYLIAYSLAGLLLGPYVLGIIKNQQVVESFGEVGILLYMLFLGIELKWPQNTSFIWKPVLFQLIKSVISLLAALLAIYLLHLHLATALVLSFILMLNNTSVATEYLKSNHAHKTEFGVLILSVLIIQDIAFTPLLSLLRFLHKPVGMWQVLAISVLTVFVTWLILRVNKIQELKIPFESFIKNDHDLQLFIGLTICFAFSILSNSIGLSTALGAFASGIILKKIRAFDWIENSLRPFKTFFMAMFFVYLGLTFDLQYFSQNINLIAMLVGFLVIFQNFFSAISFKILGYSWKNSIYAGALLSNIGELSLVIGLLAREMNLIDDNILKLVISVSILSILFTTIWTACIKTFIYKMPYTTFSFTKRNHQTFS
ncbi:MAG TPA: cation:proton antiporter [Segetibacter sp.]|nr:cation:proton antiporter [Segetibacter sp.]